MEYGSWLAFEGPDGCGKTTQLEFAYDFLVSKGLDVIKTKQPGGTPLGLKLRDILLETELDPISQLYLFLADRKHLIETVIEPALKQGKIVLCDRSCVSSYVYQGLQIDRKQIAQASSLVYQKPDAIFFFEATVANLTKRMKHRGTTDVIEKRKRYGRYVKAYKEEALLFTGSCYYFNANYPQEEVRIGVQEVLEEYFGL